jgi:[ribosomal protein S5]-alanine N-acetyltransferase
MVAIAMAVFTITAPQMRPDPKKLWQPATKAIQAHLTALIGYLYVVPAQPLNQINTSRLALRASDVALAASVADYLSRNRKAHQPWNPPMPEQIFTAEGQTEILGNAIKAEAAGTQLGWFLCSHNEPERVIGHLRFSQIFRGPFQSAMLGYAIDAEYEGEGLMREALRAALDDVFSQRVWLHRVQANTLVHNNRSLDLLERLGFVREGLSPRYLFVNGKWRDHVLTALINPHWPDDIHPA